AWRQQRDYRLAGLHHLPDTIIDLLYDPCRRARDPAPRKARLGGDAARLRSCKRLPRRRDVLLAGGHAGNDDLPPDLFERGAVAIEVLVRCIELRLRGYAFDGERALAFELGGGQRERSLNAALLRFQHRDFLLAL